LHLKKKKIVLGTNKMSSQANPIAGNQHFKGVENIAGQLDKLSVADGKLANLQAGVATVQGLMMTGGAKSLNGLMLHSVSGYAPATLAAATSYFVNKLEGQANVATPASTDTNVLVVPAGAQIVGVLLEDPTIDATVAAGTQALTGVVAAANVNLAAASAAAAVNAGAIAGVPNVPTLGAAALSVLTGSVVVAASPTVTGVTITTGAGLSTNTQLAVTVFYLA